MYIEVPEEYLCSRYLRGVCFMRTFYLVDFENIGNPGLTSLTNISDEDELHIFYTKHNYKIDLDVLSLLEGKRIIVHRCLMGDQSLDKCLVSYLGYLICSYSHGVKFVIVSNDRGYDNVVEFWRTYKHTIVRRTEPVNPSTNRFSKLEKSLLKGLLMFELQSLKLGGVDVETYIDFHIMPYVNSDNYKQLIWKSLSLNLDKDLAQNVYNVFKKIVQ